MRTNLLGSSSDPAFWMDSSVCSGYGLEIVIKLRHADLRSLLYTISLRPRLGRARLANALYFLCKIMIRVLFQNFQISISRDRQEKLAKSLWIPRRQSTECDVPLRGVSIGRELLSAMLANFRHPR